MNCTSVNAIMDDHRSARLTPAERGGVDNHLLGCADCAAAWFAHSELLAITVPAMSPALLDRMLGAVSLRTRSTHQARRGVIVATALLAGAALAAIGITQLRELTRDDSVPTSAPAPSQPLAAPAPASVTDNPTSAAPGAGGPPIDTAAIELSIAPIVRPSPDYPAVAQERGLAGSVTLQYDVTAKGAVENVSVVESTEAVFDEPAATALKQWKYLPRIAAGKRVAALAQRTVIRFQLEGTPLIPASALAPAPREGTSRQLDYPGFSAAIEVAWERVAADDLRGAELQLDETRALYDLNGFQEGGISDFYAYLYTVQGNYDRAIDAYETGIAAYARGGAPSQGSWFPLANLYYARHQYDLALGTMLTFKERIKGTPAESGRTPLADDFIARLAALGVTEKTLPARR
jgi:TonB family protein